MRNHEGRHKPYDRPNMAINKREMFNERQMMQRGEIGPMAQRGNTLYNREPFWGTPIPFQRQRSQNWWATTPSAFMSRQMYMNPFVNNFGLNFGMRSNYNPAYPQGPQPWQQQRVESHYQQKSLGKGNFRQRFVPIKPSPLDNSPPKMKRIWKAKKAGGEIIHEYAKIFPYMELIYIFSSFKSAILIDYHHVRIPYVNKMALKFKLPSSVATYGEVCFIKSAPYTFTKAESEIRQRETAKTVDVVEGGILYAELSGRIKRGQVRKMAGPEIYDFCNTAISRGHIFKLVSEPMSDVGSTNFHASGLPSGQTKGPVSTMTITVDNAIDLNARM
ncbi:hypothetical protein FSP39_006995 [Pinctada imbricata]|uniref:Uncharacterized protein n=1 Tax=Pinctada imbricata TaxID=66713 RepID=A0AA88XYS4_PINIB|nr:hypothetical protein FSP39_006995 [Pinctada imbricata]